MVSLYKYLKARLEGDPEVKAVYESMGEGDIVQMSANVRDIKYPCVVCEMGDDGRIDLIGGSKERSVQLLYVLDRAERGADGEAGILDFAKRKGREILAMMQADGAEYGSPTYGVDFSDIQYMKSSPGMYALGYCFVVTIISE